MLNLDAFNPELLLPYNLKVDANSKSCARAHKILGEALRKGDSNLMNEGLRLYKEACDSGVQEAAENALAFCVSAATHNSLIRNTKVADFADLIDSFAIRLCSIGDPVGLYYLALSTVYGFYERGQPKDENVSDFEAGWSFMIDLGRRSNVYAENFLKLSVDFSCAAVPVAKGKGVLVLPPPLQTWGHLIYKIWE